MTPNRRNRKLGIVACGVALVLACGYAANVIQGWHLFDRFSPQFGIHDRMRYLQDVAAMLENYDDLYGHLPPRIVRDKSGTACHSWRSLVINFGPSYQGREPLDTTVSWRDARNRQWSAVPDLFFCWQSTEEPLNTRVVAISGAGTPLEAEPPVRLADLPHDTITFVALAHSGVHWMEPGDLELDQIDVAFQDNNDGLGILAVFADGEVWQLARRVPLAELKRFATINGARRYDRDTQLKPFRVRQLEKPK